MSNASPSSEKHLTPSSSWLYDINVPSGTTCTIHIPLVYRAKLPIVQQAYAHALLDFPLFLEIQGFYPVMTSHATVSFDAGLLEILRELVYNEIQRGPVLDKIVKQFLLLYQWFPKVCLEQENSLITKRRVSPLKMQRLFRFLYRSITLSLFIPFIESFYLSLLQHHAGNNHFNALVKNIVLKSVFSHFLEFNRQQERLKMLITNQKMELNDLYTFCFQYGFLGDPIGDGSLYESPRFVCNKLLEREEVDHTYPVDIPLSDLSLQVLPPFQFDPERIIFNYNQIMSFEEKILYTMRVLQINEEFRHYWGIRLMRLFRLIAPDLDAQNTWILEDYVRFFKKQ